MHFRVRLKLPKSNIHSFRSAVKVKEAHYFFTGFSLPSTWAPMPTPDMTVYAVPLKRVSAEYRNVASKFMETVCEVNIQKIERIQNPYLYRQYMVRKQKVDKDNGGNNELHLFHGTDAKNIRAINTQGFNRSFCGAHGELQLLKCIVYLNANFFVYGRGTHTVYLQFGWRPVIVARLVKCRYISGVVFALRILL